MTLPRLATLLAGLVLPVLLATPADAAPRSLHRSAPAHVITAAERPASIQLVSRHRYQHRRHVTHRNRPSPRPYS